MKQLLDIMVKSFPYKAKETGTFDFEWTDDNGEKYTMSRKMTVS